MEQATGSLQQAGDSLQQAGGSLQQTGGSLQQAIVCMNRKLRGSLDGELQREGVRWMLSRELCEGVRGGILADDMGLGKTFQAIALVCARPCMTLIVTEVSTLGQWREALIEFGGIKPVVLSASYAGTALPPGIEVVLTTYSVFQRPGGVHPCLRNVRWGRIMLDEGHAIRNATTKLHKEMTRLEADIKWVISATPLQNDVKDLINEARWIGIEESDPDAICAGYVLRRTQEQELQHQLPELKCDIVRLTFKHAQEAELYREVETEYAGRIRNGSNNYVVMMEGILRCRQVCVHPDLYRQGMEKKAAGRASQAAKRRRLEEEPVSSSTKIEYVCDYIQALAPEEKTLVFCTWCAEMELIRHALDARGITSLSFDGKLNREQKDNVLYNFKNTPIPVLLLQINCGSVGLNLQCATHVLITSPNWNPTVDLQAIGRAHRKGQTKAVTCVRLVMGGTIEERCLEVSDTKASIIEDVMNDDSMKRRLGVERNLTASDMRYLFEVV
jgi:SNF2 family DNA or RNA helicase